MYLGSKHSRQFNRSNHLMIHRHHLSSSLNHYNVNSRSRTLELQTNCVAQTRNLNKRNNYLNSLKTNSVNQENCLVRKHANERNLNSFSVTWVL